MSQIPFRPSGWALDTNPERTPALEGNTTCDVVVVGGGIVGLSCAYYLRKEGLDVVLLERSHVGYASSARNAGIITPTLGPWDGTLGEVYGYDRARPLVEWLLGCVDALEQFAQEEGVDFELRRHPMWFLTQSEEEVEPLKEAYERLRKMGHQVRLVDADGVAEVTTFETHGGIAFDDHATVQPWKVTRGFREAILRSGVRLYEGSLVDGVRGGSPVEVRTSRGTVTADKAIVCTNAFGAAQFTFMRPYVSTIVHGYAIMTEPLDDETAASVGLLRDHQIMDFAPYVGAVGRGHGFWSRLLTDGRVIHGGGSGKPEAGPYDISDDLYEPRFDEIRAEMIRRFPRLKDVPLQAVWGGAMALTSTLLPIITEDEHLENVIVPLICNARGMSLGSSTGKLVKGLVMGKETLDEPTRAFLEFCAPPDDANHELTRAFDEKLASRETS